jgi:RNA polymerase sigma-70 factor (ECF subfamily)
MFYGNCDYTVWAKMIDGNQKYFITYHSQVNSQTVEICSDIFNIYISEFNKPLERQRNERRRHLEGRDLDSINLSGELAVMFEKESIMKLDALSAMSSCTEVQYNRLFLHFFEGYSFVDIANMEGRDEAAVRRSISAALKRIKKFLEGSPI